MKALRYLLITFAVMMVVNVQAAQAKAQSLAQQPTTEFHSTSTMVGSGTTLPMAVESGAHTTYDVNYNAGRANKPGIRKVGEGDGFEDEGNEPGSGLPGEPAPIGDGVWAMMMAAAVYGVWCMVYRRRKRVRDI